MTHEERIQGYFTGSLSEDELKGLHDSLQSDPDFKAEFDAYRDMHHAFHHRERLALKDHLIKLDGDQNQNIRPIYTSNWFRFAAAILLLVALSLPFLPTGSTSLYDANFDVYPNVEQPVVRSNGVSNQAFLQYENGQFQKAAQAFEIMLQSEDDPNIRFYYAMSLLNAGSIAQADEELTSLSAYDFDYQAEVFWYRALVQIQQENYSAAMKQLSAMDEMGTAFKARERQKLWKKLKRK